MAEIKFLDKTGLTQVISHLQQDTDEKITTAIEGVTYVSGDESEDAELMPVDADTLGGQLPEYYATAQGLEDLRAEVEAGGSGAEVPDGVIYMDLDSAGESIENIYNDADSLGGETAEEWQKKIDDVVDGTTVVAEATKATLDGNGNNISDTYLNKTDTAVDSEKLGGKNASEYVLDFEVVEDVNSITKSGFYRCTTNLPFDYGLANVIMVGDTSNTSNIPTQIAFGIDLNPTTRDLIAVRSYDGSNWTEWTRVAKNTDLANYVPFTNGNIDITKTNGTDNYVAVQTEAGNVIYLMAGASGNSGLYSNRTNGFVVKVDNSGNATFNGTATENLPLSGGTLNAAGCVVFKPLTDGGNAVGNYFINSDGTTFGGMGMLAYYGTGNSLYLSVSEQPYDLSTGLAITASDIKWKDKSLLHTGNKPMGSYVGNGSSETRNIVTNGSGYCILVWNSHDASSVAIVTPWGAICKVGTTCHALDYGSCGVDMGVMRLNTADNMLNGSGITYHYQVL